MCIIYMINNNNNNAMIKVVTQYNIDYEKISCCS